DLLICHTPNLHPNIEGLNRAEPPPRTRAEPTAGRTTRFFELPGSPLSCSREHSAGRPSSPPMRRPVGKSSKKPKSETVIEVAGDSCVVASPHQIDVTPEIDEIAELRRKGQQTRVDNGPDAPWRQGHPYDVKVERSQYEHEKRKLQIELLKLQAWV